MFLHSYAPILIQLHVHPAGPLQLAATKKKKKKKTGAEPALLATVLTQPKVQILVWACRCWAAPSVQLRSGSEQWDAG